MKEVKEKKKPILFYYIVALAVIFIFNAIARPYYDSQSVKQVDYGTFMNMTEDEQIADVQIEENQILFRLENPGALKVGKSYVVCLNVTPEGNAVNAKPTQVKLTVRIVK